MHYIALPFVRVSLFLLLSVFRLFCYSRFLSSLYLQGLFAENKEKLITGAITALLAMEGIL